MATVFKAYHPALDRHVAIKAMHPAFMQDPQFLARFEREARVVASLDHPNIVPIYDFAQQGGQPYLVMKFVEGQTLKAVLDSRSLTQAEILHAVKAVGAALGYAHKRGVLHRDIKPSNVLLTADGQVYLADFGLARIAEAGQSSLSGDQLLGTPHYISPEQARGERDLDQGTDIYSLGIVLYQLTVGRVPFNADTPFSIIHDHIYTPLPMPRETHPEMSEALENVLLKALAKDRGDRFATVDDLVRAFEAAFTGKTVRPPAQVTTVAAGGASRGVVAKPRLSAGGAEPADAARPSPRPQPSPAVASAPARRRWPWVLGGLGLTSLCLLTFAAAASQELRTIPTTPSDAASPGPALVTTASVAPADLPLEPDAVQAAQAAVDRSPEDPQARLELAKTLEAGGQLPQAYLEFMKAGELFLQQGTFTRAADALLGAARLQQQRATQDPRLGELLTQALFFGAPTGEMLPWVQSASELTPPYPSLDALEARARLFMGEQDRAKQLLGGILTARPEDLLAGAVMVDLLQAEGNTPEAIAQADRILARPRLPDWLTKHLNGLKASMIAP
jgi:serine/threonine-protein kinase